MDGGKQHRNGDNGTIHIAQHQTNYKHSTIDSNRFAGSFSGDFGEFVARDNYFNSSSNNTISNSVNNFPIGTFSIEQATQPAVSQSFPQTDYFNPATASQLMSM